MRSNRRRLGAAPRNPTPQALTVGDADHEGGLLAGADAVGEADAAVVGGVPHVGEHLQFEWAGELSHAGGEVGAHQIGGIRAVL